MSQIGSDEASIWLPVELIPRQILGHTSRDIEVCWLLFISGDINQDYGKYNVHLECGSWYPKACSCPGLKHLLCLPFKGI
jgi:hypothetical protein